MIQSNVVNISQNKVVIDFNSRYGCVKAFIALQKDAQTNNINVAVELLKKDKVTKNFIKDALLQEEFNNVPSFESVDKVFKNLLPMILGYINAYEKYFNLMTKDDSAESTSLFRVSLRS